MAQTIGTAYIAIAPNMSGVQGKIAGGLKGSGSAFAEQFGTEVSGKSAVIIGAIAGVAQAATQKAMGLISSSIGDAIARVDTLKSAQKTFEYMGFAASDAAVATKAVTKSIQGLPTPLDGAIRGMTSLAATYGDVKLGQKVFTALNDAILGFGGTADMVNNAIQQVSQLPMDGPLDAQTWNSLRNSGITPVLVAMGKDMKKSVSTLKTEFGDGTLKVKDFVNELIKLDTQGGGGLVKLSDIAQNATSGIATGFANMKTAITRGLANIILSIGQANISGAIATIGAAFEKVLNFIAKEIPVSIGYIKEFFGYVQKNKDVFYPIAIAIGAVVGAIVAWKTALLIWSGVTKAATAVMAAFDAVMALNPIVAITLALIGLTAGIGYLATKTENGRKVFDALGKIFGQVFDIIAKIGLALFGQLGTEIDQTGTHTQVFEKLMGKLNAGLGYVLVGLNYVSHGLDILANYLGMAEPYVLKLESGLSRVLIPVKELIYTLGKLFVDAIGLLIKAMAWVAKEFIDAYNYLTKHKKLVENIAIVIGTLLIPQMIKLGVQAAMAAAKTAASWAVAFAKFIAQSVVAFAQYLAGLAVAVAQTLLAGARMAAGWLLALGPIGLIVAAVAAAVALIIANWDKVGPFFAGLWKGIQNVVSGVIDWIKNNWPLLLAILTGPIGLAVLFIIKHWQAIKDGAAAMIDGVIGFFTSLPGRILGAIGGLGSLLYNSGRDLINGLLNGAGSLLSKIGQFFLDRLPSWIQGPFKKALGINSPSKVFAGYGDNIGQGLVDGVANQAGAVKRAVNGLADSAISGMTNGNLTSDFSASIAATDARIGSDAGAAVAAGPAVVQNNNVYTQVDLNTVTRELAWQVRR